MLMKKQMGVTIIDAILAILVLSVGTLGILKYSTESKKASMMGNQRAEAMLIAQAKVESFRKYSKLDTTANATAYADIVSGSDSVTGQNATYSRRWAVTTNTSPDYKSITVSVGWTSADNTTETVSLVTNVAKLDPEASGELFATNTSSLSPNSAEEEEVVSSVHENVPDSATDNEDGTSDYSPNDGSSVVLTYDNTSGEVTEVNQVASVEISGSVSVATGGDAPTGGVDLSTEITIDSSSDDERHCVYTASTSSSASFICYIETAWSGNIYLSATGSAVDAKACINHAQPYSNVTANQNSQDFTLYKSSRSCGGGLTELQAASIS